MSTVDKEQYHFSRDAEGWVVYHHLGGGDYRVTKELLQTKLYNAFQQVLEPEHAIYVDNCRAKLPTYLQFDGTKVRTDNGVIDTCLELYIRRHTIEQVHMIVKGTQGTTARVPVDHFNLTLPVMDLGTPIEYDPVDISKMTTIEVPALWHSKMAAQ